MFGLLCYNNSYNLGDEIQSIATQQFLPSINYLIDRDTSIVTPVGDHPPLTHLQRVSVIYNGWFDGQYCKFPFPAYIDPLFISFHINETDHSSDSTYKILETQKIPFVPLSSHINYLSEYSPIGCRDIPTLQRLQKVGVASYWSGCMTLTLKNRFRTRNQEILIVDSHIMCPDLLNEIIPAGIQNQAVKISQALSQKKSHSEKMELAQQFLDRLAQAKLVITSRLHTALPCLAFNTPVIFLHDNLQDIRFGGLIKYLKTYTTGQKLDVDLATYQNPKNAELEAVKTNLIDTVKQWVIKKSYPSAVMKQLLMTPQRGTSIVSVCMNRHEHLKKSLPSWIATQPDEIVLIDWGSVPPISDIVDKFKNPLVRLVRIDDVKNWVLTYSFNLGFRLARYQNVLKVDCDSVLDPHFLAYHNLDREGIFFAGDWRQARDTNEKHLNGVLYVRRDDFFNAGGYNEYITTYGYDDCDLYTRLEKSLQRLLLNLETIKHIPHTNLMRTSNSTSAMRLDIEIEKNRLISEAQAWTSHQTFSNFVVGSPYQVTLSGNGRLSQFSALNLTSHFITLNYTGSPVLSETVVTECQNRAIRNREYVLKMNPPRPRLYIQPINGLGNRLRALASAACLAQACQRQLVIIWIPDHHCEAKFTDLFKVNYLFRDCIIWDSWEAVTIPNFESVGILQRDGSNGQMYYYNYVKSKDKEIDDKQDGDIYIISACVLKSPLTGWSKECLWLRNLEVTDEIGRVIYDFTKGIKITDMIGLHIRMGQDANIYSYEDCSNYSTEAKMSLHKWRGQSHWSIFLKEMTRILSETPQQMFFLCCDDSKAYEILSNDPVCKDRIVYIQRQDYDRSLSQVKSAVVDAMLLSKTKCILGSNWSSFTEIAHRLGGQTLKLAGVDFKGDSD